MIARGSTLVMAFWLCAPIMALGEDSATFHHDIPSYVEQAREAGIAHVYDGPFEYFVGGGAAGFDCNGDRKPDLLIAGGTNPTALYVNRSKVGGQLQFETKPFDLSPRDLARVTGAYPVDIDNDRITDVMLLRVGENILLRGEGDCTFSKANSLFAFDGGREWSTGFSATWEAGNDHPTLAVGNYIDRSAPGSPWGTCSPNELLRPAGGKADYSQKRLLEPGYCSLSMLFTDWNNSGTADLRITNDRQYYRGGEEQLWSVPPGRPARAFRSGDGWQRLQIWGMGIASADLDNDGRPEFALTSMGDTKLQTLDEEAEEDRPVYRDMAFERGATAHRPYLGDTNKPSTGWHSQFADVNNDGRLDLFIAKGNVEAMPDFAAHDPDNLLMGTESGRFHEVGGEAGIALETKGRGGLVMDFNHDGMLDLLVVNRGQNVSLFRNRGVARGGNPEPMGNWLAVELDNGDTNPAAIGARIVAKTGNISQTRTIKIGGGHASGQIGFAHFGVGTAERVTLRIRWPDGAWSHEYRVFANHFVVIRKGDADARLWYPPPTRQ